MPRITGLKFFFDVTLGDAQRMAKMRPVRIPRTLPVVLSPDEVARLLAAAGNLKPQTALAIAYGAGLRASEVVALKVTDIDSERMTLHIEQGKGREDRYAMLSPVLLERLRVWWRVARAQGLHKLIVTTPYHHHSSAMACHRLGCAFRSVKTTSVPPLARLSATAESRARIVGTTQLRS